jgi:hypothetical protein
LQLRQRRLFAHAEVAGAGLRLDVVGGGGDVDDREVAVLQTALGLRAEH